MTASQVEIKRGITFQFVQDVSSYSIPSGVTWNAALVNLNAHVNGGLRTIPNGEIADVNGLPSALQQALDWAVIGWVYNERTQI